MKIPEGQDKKLYMLRARAKNYGITVEIYEQQLRRQNWQCGICGKKKPGGRWDTWEFDHCHQTGRFRGLLCNNCNGGLGKFKDDPELVERAAQYLRNPLPTYK